MSESMYRGQVNRSTDTRTKGKVNKIKNGLTLIIKRIFAKNISEKNTNTKFKYKNAYCHSFPKNTLQIAIKKTGTVKKKGDILSEFSSK